MNFNMSLKKIKNMPDTVKASLAYTVCSILQKSLSFITLPLFTRLLTTEQYGQFSVYSSWMAILTIFVTLNLPFGSFSTAMIKFEDDRNGYISSVQNICTILSAVFLLVYLPLRKVINPFLELPTYLVIIMVVEMLATASFSFWCGKKRFEYKYKGVVVLTLAMSVLSPLLSYILVKNTIEKGYARIIGCSVITISFGMYLFVINALKGKKLYDKEYWKFALGFNVPLIIYYLSQVIFNQSDRIMISHYSGTDKAGIYNVAYSLALVLTFVLNAINNSYVPWLYEQLKNRTHKSNRSITNIITIIMAVLLLGIIWAAPEIIMIMAGDKYEEAKWIVPPVAMSLILLLYAQYFINIQFFMERKKELIAGSVFAALVNVVLNAILIPNIGYIAAGYTTLISYMIFACSNYWVIKKEIASGGCFEGTYDFRSLIIILVIFLAAGFIGVALYNLLIIRLVIIAIAMVGVLINKNKILPVIKQVINLKKKD